MFMDWEIHKHLYVLLLIYTDMRSKIQFQYTFPTKVRDRLFLKLFLNCIGIIPGKLSNSEYFLFEYNLVLQADSFVPEFRRSDACIFFKRKNKA